jgi:integrase
MHRVAAFLLDPRQSSADTTADLSTAMIANFAGTLGDLGESNRNDILRAFRRLCRLAVERKCLKRNPFDSYPLPKSKDPTTTVPRGPQLDADQVRVLMDHLKARVDTWEGHRLYAFTATVLYARLQTTEVLRLKLEDCDLAGGVIRLPRKRQRAANLEAFPPKAVPIPPRLGEILVEWIDRRRRKSYRKPGSRLPYGTRLAEDGRSRIADEKERAVIAEMIRWRDEGWAIRQITRELNRKGIPTKRGAAKWEKRSVKLILERERPGADVASDANDRDANRPDPGWMFPCLSRDSPWSISASAGYSAIEQLREAGKALGIEGLTFEPLRRFHREHTRHTLDFPGAEVASVEAEPVPSTGGDPDAELAKLTRKQALVVRALIEAEPEGLTGASIEAISGVPGWWKILRHLKESGPYWDARVFPPGRGEKKYRIKMF